MILWLLIGALCALLTHWVYRHTYDDYDFDENGHKVYIDKITMPRYFFFIIWILLPLCGGISLFFTPIIINCYWEPRWHFYYENKLTRWLLKEI